MPRIDDGLCSMLAQLLPRASLDSVKPLQVSGLTGESWRLQGAGFDLLAREASGQKIFKRTPSAVY
ncbi:MAG: hypothetical protein ACMX3H_03410 [Sodalis sp. (in: enterobacteria)]|uniref:hypothetical protein n=1 Tax=Sodalis sp. (in: enterobacteria) TaxID=1898979 RepID=UPI0039E3483C